MLRRIDEVLAVIERALVVVTLLEEIRRMFC